MSSLFFFFLSLVEFQWKLYHSEMEGEREREREGWRWRRRTKQSRRAHFTHKLEPIILYCYILESLIWFVLNWTHTYAQHILQPSKIEKDAEEWMEQMSEYANRMKKKNRAKMFHVQVLSVFVARQAHMMSMHTFVSGVCKCVSKTRAPSFCTSQTNHIIKWSESTKKTNEIINKNPNPFQIFNH